MDLAGASGPGGIKSVRSHMWTHTNARLLVRTQATLRAVQSECVEDNDSKHPPPTHTQAESDRLMKRCVSCTHKLTHRDQCLNRCVPTSELLLSAEIIGCTYSDRVCVCVTEMPAATLKPPRAEVPETFVIKSENSCESMTTRWLFPEDGPDSGGGGEQMWQGEINNNNTHTITDGCTIADSVLELNRNKIWLPADKNIFTRRHFLSFQ